MNDIIPPRGRIHSDARVRDIRRPIVVTRRDINNRPALDNKVGGGNVKEKSDLKAPAKQPVVKSLTPEKKAQILADIAKKSQKKRKLTHVRKRRVKPLKPVIPIKPKKRKISFDKVILAGLVIIVVGVTGYVSIDTWLTNNRVKASELQPVGTEQGDVKSADASYQAQEGTDTTKPHASALANYKVADDLPRALYIEKLGIAARIKPMGVNNDGSIQAPINIYDSGWCNGSVKPGQIGAMFIDGHASGASREGLFAYLDTLSVGDQISVEKGDGTRLNYKVVHTAVVDLDKVDMKSMLLPYGNALRGLNLMTCTGHWVNEANTMDKRVLVYTEQI